MTDHVYGASAIESSFFASWMPGGRLIWQLPQEFNEFVGITCFLDEPGWVHVSAQIELQARNHPQFSGLLVISRTGLLECAAPSLPRKIHAMVSGLSGRFLVLVCADRPGRLVHAKGWACRTNGRSSTWIGSANLTGPGIGGNAEMGTLIRGEAQFAKFSESVRAIARNAANFADIWTEVERSLLRRRDADEQRERDFPTSPEPSHEQTELFRQRPALTPGDACAQEEAAAWLSSGCRLARQHEPDQYAISFPLKRYIDAGLLSHEEAEDKETGIRVGGKQKALYVPLLPREWKERLRVLNHALGRLLGRYSVEIAGATWCPHAWIPELRAAWMRERASLDATDLKGALVSHVETLRRTIQRTDHNWLNVSRLFSVSHPDGWHDKAEKILGQSRYQEASEHPDRRTEIVAAFILRELNATVGRQLNLEYLVGLLQHIGSPPHSYPFAFHDVGSVLDAALDLVLVGLEPLIRAGGAWKPRSNSLVAGALKDACTLKPDEARDAWARALALKNHPERTIDEAWGLCATVFGLRQRPITWERPRTLDSYGMSELDPDEDE